jgi:outer membrane protein assembly factor BamE (lipoprotein component of BamABCDE complex)
MKVLAFFRKSRILVFLLVSAFLAGCGTTGSKNEDPKLAKIKQGVTTRKEVLETLGPPERITHDGIGRTTFVYRLTTKKSKRASVFSTFDTFTMDDFDDNVVRINTLFFGPDDVVTEINSATETTNIKDQLN